MPEPTISASQERRPAGRPARWLLSASISCALHLALLLIFTQMVFRDVDTSVGASVVFDVRLLGKPKGQKAEGLPKDGEPEKREVEKPAEQTVELRAPQAAKVEAAAVRPTEGDKPAEGRDRPHVISVDTGPRSIYGGRTETARQQAVQKWGGSAGSENAVKEGLKWLAAHQDQDGRWDGDDFAKNCGDAFAPCDGGGAGDVDVGVTGFAILAFVGAGHTQTAGDYKKSVASALQYLKNVQGVDGCFDEKGTRHMYGQGIATLALAETLNLTGDAALRETIQKAVDFIVSAQQEEGGWDYTHNQTGRNDTSLTGWQVMALKSARTAGLNVPNSSVRKAIEHFKHMTDATGRVKYVNRDNSPKSLAMTAAGMVCRQFMGWKADADVLRKGARFLLDAPPSWQQAEEGKTFAMYYWYYGTLAMFQMGGDYWKVWNIAMRDTLVERQRLDGHARGSWDPVSACGKVGGRVYSTAINVLNLEVYYRYLPLFDIKGNDAVLALADTLQDDAGNVRQDTAELLMTLGPEAAVPLIAAFKDCPARLKQRITRFLAPLKDDASVAALQQAMADDNNFVRLEAAKALASQSNPSCTPGLRSALQDKNDFIRSEAINALSTLATKEAVELLIEALGDHQPFIRNKASVALSRLCGPSASAAAVFKPDAPAADREAAIARWREWWREHSEKWQPTSPAPPPAEAPKPEPDAP